MKVDVACRPIVTDVLKTMYKLGFKSPCSDFQNPLMRPSLPSEIMLAIGGWRHHLTNWVEAYDSRADYWVDTTQQEMPPLSFHGTVYLKRYVYCIGGYDGLSCIDTMHRFDPITRTWWRVAPINPPCYYVSVTVLDSFIYAMGGLDGPRHLNTAEEYNPDTEAWTIIQPMSEQLHGKVSKREGDHWCLP